MCGPPCLTSVKFAPSQYAVHIDCPALEARLFDGIVSTHKNKRVKIIAEICGVSVSCKKIITWNFHSNTEVFYIFLSFKLVFLLAWNLSHWSNLVKLNLKNI